MQESIGPKFSYRPVSELDNENEMVRMKTPTEPLVGILKNGNVSKQPQHPEAENKLLKNSGITGVILKFI
jgi:hypothetical protein